MTFFMVVRVVGGDIVSYEKESILQNLAHPQVLIQVTSVGVYWILQVTLHIQRAVRLLLKNQEQFGVNSVHRNVTKLIREPDLFKEI